jgi:cell division initiation protein
MKVTPLDLRQAQFKTKMRGYDPQEVGPFLADAANELEQALREIDRLRQDLARSETAMVEHRDRETSLRNTLLTAQRLADSIKENAENEARTVIREAETRADMLLQKAQARLLEVERDINEMKLRRRDVEGSLETSIASLTYALDFMRGQDLAEREEKQLLLHRPKAADLVAAAGPQGIAPISQPQITPAAAAVASGPQAVVNGPHPLPGIQPLPGPQSVSGPQAITGPQAVPSLRSAEARFAAQNSDARPQVTEKAG